MKLFTGVLLSVLLSATAPFAETCLMLPLYSSSPVEDANVVHELFVEAFSAQYGGTVREAGGSEGCRNSACALAAAGQAGADRVVYTALRKLGSKLILTGTIVTVAGTTEHSVRATGTSIEDMEAVTKRVADALVTGKTLEEAATTENITAKEEENEPTRRKGLYMGGISVGYLFPWDNSYRELSYDFSYGSGSDIDTMSATFKDYSQIIKLNWRNWYEFRDNMVVTGDVYFLMPVSVGGSFNYYYLTNNGDFTPFLTGGIGLEYVFNDIYSDTYNDVSAGTYFIDGDFNDPVGKRHSGPSFNVGVGFLAFRTYDIHLLGQVTYNMVVNTDFDNGLTAELGTVYRPRKSENKSESSSSSYNSCLYGAAGLLLLSALLSSL